MPTERRPMQPADIRRQIVLEEHDLAPDGSFAVVVKRFVRGNQYGSELWRFPTGDARGRPRRLTSGKVRDSRPRISPDGRRVAFLRRDLDGRERPGRLYVLDLERPSARPVPLTPSKLGAAEAEWAPDGTRLAFTAEVDPPRFIVGDARLGKEPMARRIRRIDWRMDEIGHVDRWSHLFVIEARRGASPTPLTEGDWGVEHPAWSPDGREIAFAADRGEAADLEPSSSIWAVPAAAHGPTEPRSVLALDGWANRPAWSPDGRFVVAVGVAEAGAPDEISPGLFVGPADGSGSPWPLAPELDRPIGQWTDTDLTGWMVSARSGPDWIAPDQIVATVSDRGRSVPWRFPVDPATGRPTGAPEPAIPGDVVTESMAATDGRLSVLATDGSRALELYDVEADGQLRRRSRQGSAWQARLVVPEMRLVEAPGPGGPIDVWIASPPGAGEQALPTIVDVHGGPLGAWAPAPAVEVHLLVGRGYRVILPNIRGSATYGRDWIEPQLGDWGGADAADVHAALDHVVGLGLADPERLGVLGLSYGGFMVHWLVATSDRFKAAVSENGVANQVSAWANSDTGVVYDRTARLGDVFSPEGVDKLWRQSPLAHVTGVRTPLLMFQGEADRRCPPGDNEQFFIALRALRREVEYVLYPDEFHTFATTGRPDRRIDRMTRMLDWFDRFVRRQTGA